MRHLLWIVCSVFISVPTYAAEHHSAHVHSPVSANDEQYESQSEHVAPAPPTLTMDKMSDADMNEMMEMNDNAAIGMLLVDQAESRFSDGEDALYWDVSAFYGNDFNKLIIKSEGEHQGSDTDSSNELLFNRIVSRWWSAQAGVRHDTAAGPARTWAAFGVQGLAPNWFDVDATIYLGDQGRTALRFTSEYELLLTQRWILQPKLELNAYGQRDERNGLGAGLADAELGIRVRYEIRREFAPYVGVSWTRLFGDTAKLAQRRGVDRSELQWLAGVRVWF
jgi:copper resistance protein B